VSRQLGPLLALCLVGGACRPALAQSAGGAASPGSAAGSLVIKLLADEGGVVTVSSGEQSETVALLDDGVAPDPVAGDGLWCGATALHGASVKVTRRLDEQTWEGTFTPTGAKPELILRPDGAALVEVSLGSAGASPDRAVSPWSALPSPRPPYRRLLLLALALLAAGGIVGRLRSGR